MKSEQLLLSHEVEALRQEQSETATLLRCQRALLQNDELINHTATKQLQVSDSSAFSALTTSQEQREQDPLVIRPVIIRWGVGGYRRSLRRDRRKACHWGNSNLRLETKTNLFDDEAL